MVQGDFAFILHDSRTRQVSRLEATGPITELYDDWLHEWSQHHPLLSVFNNA